MVRPVDDGGFSPPAYPYDLLKAAVATADAHEGGRVDLSIGTPCDPPPALVVEALATSGRERGYPPSVGDLAFREAASAWVQSSFGVGVEPENVAACIGTKEMVAGMPAWLRLRWPSRDTVLYPAISYPSYAMGATLAGCRAVPVPWGDNGLDLDSVDPSDIARALCLWVNSPGNPAGTLDDLAAAAAWGRRHDVVVLSDECYAAFTWDGPAATVLADGLDGVLAIHSLSKRSNMAGVRAGFYTGDPELVAFLSEVRKHAGFMVPGPVQAAAAAAWSDETHVLLQRQRYQIRMRRMIEILAAIDIHASMPGGAFYLFPAAPDGDAWALVDRLAAEAGVVVAPGEFYGPDAADHVRIALVQPDDRLELIARRLGLA